MRQVQEIINDLKKGIPNLSQEEVAMVNTVAINYLNGEDIDPNVIKGILEISNILYNNTSNTILPLEDGIYDKLVVKYNNATGGYSPVGALPINFPMQEPSSIEEEKKELVYPIEFIPDEVYDKMMYFDNIMHNQYAIPQDFYQPSNDPVKDLGKIKHTVKHSYPELVGTLNKCKYTLYSEAAEVQDVGSETPIFERDFLYATWNAAMANSTNGVVGMIMELKYDGVSVEIEVDGDTIISATSRGDTANDIASDYTPIFGGKKFARATGIVPQGIVFGIKCEAIITERNLNILRYQFGKAYKNARVAIIGILGSSDAIKYRDLITLVPICTAGLNFRDPVQEVEFLNKYYSMGVDMRYAYVESADYNTILYSVYRFTKDAEAMRPYIDFMYDGVVVSYTDPRTRAALGRVNSINLWSIAIKFNALSKDTIFLGMKYTVGQNGLITPMAHFKPVEFMGTIHDKTTVHSKKRVRQLQLHIGDIVKITYRNDVICYLSKPYNPLNDNNPNPVVEFPDVCPSCGTPLQESDTGDSAYCPNMRCPARAQARIANMVKKLGVKDFSKVYLTDLNIQSFTDLLSVTTDRAVQALGEILGHKLMERIQELKTTSIPDYRIIGALGFDSISIERWRVILREIGLDELIHSSKDDLYQEITYIKGMGDVIARTIVEERDIFLQDLVTILNMPNVHKTKGEKDNVKGEVRFTGFRSIDLERAFSDAGFDSDSKKGITKKTTILIIPYAGFTSSKTKRVPETCSIMTSDQAWEYLRNLHS